MCRKENIEISTGTDHCIRGSVAVFYDNLHDKGKPSERVGRKATGLSLARAG